MSPITRGRLRDQLTFVQVNAKLLYGWKSADLAAGAGVTQADLSNGLGHLTAVQASAIANAIMVTGANSPRPARAVKTFKGAAAAQRGSISSFVAYNKTAAAAGLGFSISKPSRGVSLQAPSAARRTFTGIVELSNGLLYAQPVNTVDGTAERRAVLGMQIASEITDAERPRLITGSKSKPARMRIFADDGYLTMPCSSSFIDDASAAGWSVASGEMIEFPANGAGAPP
jgi:hypothetical protein